MNDEPLTMLEASMLVAQLGGWQVVEIDRELVPERPYQKRGWVVLSEARSLEMYFKRHKVTDEFLWHVYGVRRVGDG